MIAINPKLEFKLRTLENWVGCLVGFGAFAMVVALVFPSPLRWLVDFAGIAVAYYVLFHVLDKRASLIKCPECRKPIATNTPWVCGVGVCGKHNLRVDDYPFVYKCEHCGVEPKAYRCHHPDCGKLIFFTEDRQEVNHARCLMPEAPLPTRDDTRASRADEKEAVLHQIDMVKHNAELAETKQNIENRKRTKKEQIEESFQNYRGTVLGARGYAREWKARVTVELKDDPEALQDELDALHGWLVDKGIE